MFQERTYKTYQSIEFFPQNFTQYLLSPEVGFNKCEVLSIPAHPSKGFQRPIQLFTKAGTSPTCTRSNVESSPHRFIGREKQKKELERRAFERDLFPHEIPKFGNSSDLSQRSVESLSHYDQLQNVYAPSATPCYDTPSHNPDSLSFESEKMCYVDVNAKGDPSKQESSPTQQTAVSSKPMELKTTGNLEYEQSTFGNSYVKQQKRKIEEASSPTINGDDNPDRLFNSKRSRVDADETIVQDTPIGKIDNNQSSDALSPPVDVTRQKEYSLVHNQRNESSASGEQKVEVSPRTSETNAEKT